MSTSSGSTALLSVTDKAGLAELAAVLRDRGVMLLASSGTKKFLEGEGIDAVEISSYTESPEILGGRVKTLHPKIHGGILADRDNADHVKTLADGGTNPIDYVVVNLYPFEQKYREGGLDTDEMVEFIDIGGITLLRAAAKNHKHVTVLTNPAGYGAVIEELRASGSTRAETRRRLAAETFALTSTYDAAIARYMSSLSPSEGLPKRIPLGLEKVADVRYGENPHQRGALYRTAGDSPLLDMEQLQGKELSFNNYLDIVGAFTLARDLGPKSVGVIKHTNPCGAAWCGDVLQSYHRALETDKTSAFGGIVAINGTINGELAVQLTQIFLEVVIARDIDDEAGALFRKKKNLRVIIVPERHWSAGAGGALGVYVQDVMLYQDEDAGFPELESLDLVTKKQPSDREMVALKMAWKVAKHVKSNAIVICDERGTVGIGAGQMSRVDSSQIATRKAYDAGLSLVGKVAASDAFFPFADGVKELAKSGIAAVIQPGGSIRDKEVIAAADEANVAMVFTGRRHFRHI